jgi:hypothetical protein
MNRNNREQSPRLNRKGKTVAAIGFAGVSAFAGVGLNNLVSSAQESFADRTTASEFANRSIYEQLIKNELIDPRNQKIYQDMSHGKTDGDPFKMVLKDGSIVTIGVVGIGTTAEGIAHKLAPEDDDLTNISKVIVAQTSPTGDPGLIQPGDIYIVPDSLIQNPLVPDVK